MTRQDIHQGVFWMLLGEVTESESRCDVVSDVVSDVVLYMSLIKGGTDG